MGQVLLTKADPFRTLTPMLLFALAVRTGKKSEPLNPCRNNDYVIL
jgi:hypothetical protein